MEELGVFDGKGHKRLRRQAKYSTRTEMLHMDAGYLAAYAFLNSIKERKKKRKYCRWKVWSKCESNQIGFTILNVLVNLGGSVWCT